MVVLSEGYLQNPEKHAIKLALKFSIAPKTFRKYIDDSYARFGRRKNATEFLNVLNSRNPQIQYTIEYKNDNTELNFLNESIMNNLKYSLDLAKYRKPAITSVWIKPHSNIYISISYFIYV